MQQPELLNIFINPLEKAGFEYFVTGSVAAIFYGEPRLTHDIDIVIHLESNDIDAFCSLFPIDSFYCPPQEVIEIEINRETHAHFNLIHHNTGLKADCYPITGDILHKWAIKNKKRILLSDAISLWLAPIEYVIIRKLQFFREGGSAKHINDIKKMIKISSEEIDYNFLSGKIEKYSLQDQWVAVTS